MARLRHIAVCVKRPRQGRQVLLQGVRVQEDRPRGPRHRLGDLHERRRHQHGAAQLQGQRRPAASDLKEGQTFIGTHHFGIQVDDLVETQKKIEAAGGKFFFDLGDERHGNFERKFKDPDGVIFDISKSGWQGTDGYSKK